jgi:hypothetical protein
MEFSNQQVLLMLFPDVVVHQQLQRPNQVLHFLLQLELNLFEFFKPHMPLQF